MSTSKPRVKVCGAEQINSNVYSLSSSTAFGLDSL